MDRSPKCPKCSARIDKKEDALPKEEWPMPEWTIYRCKNCGAVLEEDNRSIFFQFFAIAFIVISTQWIGALVGYAVSGGSDLVADIFSWGIMAAGLLWFVTRPTRLGERGAYASKG